MNLLIPVDSNTKDKAVITALDKCVYWAFIQLEEGRISSCKFYKNRDDIEIYIQTIVVINEKEYVWQFQEEGIAVLIAPVQKSIDEIVEAFLFKELHDLNI